MPNRFPGWYVDSIRESVLDLVFKTRKQDTSAEKLGALFLDTSAPGHDELTPEEHVFALALAAGVAIRLLADGGVPGVADK